jgi:hypothetical protein
MRRRSVLYGSLAIVAVGLFVACGEDSPTRPSPPNPSPFAGIEVIGPDSVAAGQSVQFVARIRQADGTTKSATNMPNLRWRSSSPSVISVSDTGVVTARSVTGREALITADIAPQGTIRGTREVVIQPQGTYRITGSVRESDAPAVPVAGARVEVLPGSQFTLTNNAGQYRLYGVPPQSTIRITAAGYETIEQPLDLTANVTRSFDLNLNGPRLALNGPYTLSVDAVSACSLDSALLHRTYDAVLTTTGSVVDVVLTEPRFRLDSNGRGNRFKGRVLAGGATFRIEGYDPYYWYGEYSYPNLVESLGDNTYLVVEGWATTTGSAAGLTGTLTGSINHWDSQFGFIAGCFGANIQFRVMPR